MDITPDAILHAPATSTDDPSPSIERVIGELIAGAASLVAQSLGEHKRHGGMSADTKQRGGMIVAGLIELWQGTAGELDFDRVARTAGKQMLLERCGNDITAATVDTLIEVVLDIVHKIARLRLS